MSRQSYVCVSVYVCHIFHTGTIFIRVSYTFFLHDVDKLNDKMDGHLCVCPSVQIRVFEFDMHWPDFHKMSLQKSYMCFFTSLTSLLLAAGVLSSELSAFIVDTENGQYDDSLHQAAWRGDVEELRNLLAQGVANVDAQLRPFYATPLRLAAMNRHADCVALLLQHGSSVNIVDRKGQTPLFCAVKNWDTDSCIALLKAGASPDGDRRNLSSPLHIACQDGYAIGVKLLLDFGAQIECAPTTPQWTHPLHLATTYRCDPVFVHLWVQFGGNLWDRNDKQQLAVDLPDNCQRDILKELMENPLSLQSICRLKIRKLVGRSRLPLMCALDISQVLRDFLVYRDIPEVNHCLTSLNLELKRSLSKWQ
ncbi:ankyrin repeat and SOCS box protein 1 isoform X2 [Cryptotermes secundus]|uniref:ankyrin repeat and SOCS box protein 1 isoform X2 n=1 Tax=Cryptotermes secundus TaxID=105785 RepID=UPI001454B8D4|nr:ankyrin repeat and SOCS box protein 1 isoform X2 [Cryptotermes secundus]